MFAAINELQSIIWYPVLNSLKISAALSGARDCVRAIARSNHFVFYGEGNVTLGYSNIALSDAARKRRKPIEKYWAGIQVELVKSRILLRHTMYVDARDVYLFTW